MNPVGGTVPAGLSDLTHVAAFSLGVITGAVLMLRLARVLIALMREERRRDRDDD